MLRACFTGLLLLLTACGNWSYKVPTAAMEPTIKNGTSVRVDHSFYSNHAIARFDIVLYKEAQNGGPQPGGDTKIVKRVIGLGGETVEIVEGKVLINGVELKQTFASIPDDDNFGPVTVPAGEYFLLGDNRANSYDSRHWNPPTIRAGNIKGKVTEIKNN